MARRFDRYRVKTRDNLGDPEFWNPRFEDIDLRLHASEEALKDIDAVADRVEGTAISRINEVVTPLVVEAIERVQQIPEMFEATSATSLTIGTGLKTFIVEQGERNTFAPLRTVMATVLGDGSKGMGGDVISFDRGTGELIVDVVLTRGAGTFATWEIATSPPIDVAHASRTDDPHQSAAQAIAALRNGVSAPGDDLAKLYALILLRATLASPAFSGNPTAPTPPPGTNSTQIATTAFVKAAIDALVSAAPGALDTLDELAAALGDDANFAATVTTALANRLRVDAAQSLTALQQQTARSNIGLGHPALGQCTLKYVNAGILRLDPYNGNRIFIDGSFYTVPSAGVQLSNSGANPNTLYYIYARWTGSALALERSVTPYAVDAIFGHCVKSGDGSRTLVGMAYTNGSSAWQLDANNILVRSWFSDPGVQAISAFGGVVSASLGSWTEIYSATRINFLAWAGEIFESSCCGVVYNGTAAGDTAAGMALDSTTAVGSNAFHAVSATANFYLPAFSKHVFTIFTEGFHYSTITGISSGGVGNWSLANFLTSLSRR